MKNNTKRFMAIVGVGLGLLQYFPFCGKSAFKDSYTLAMTRRLTIGILGTTLGFMLSVGSVGAATPGQADRALDRALQRLVAMTGGPSGVIAVVQRGTRLTIHSFGVSELGTARKSRIDDHMRLASVSKAFSGATALALVSKGSLSIDDTIGERLPELPAAWHDITLRQLLAHTSGLPNYLDSAQDAIAASPTMAPPPEQLLAFIKDEPLRFTPGSRYEYSNSDNIVVGLMVAAATEKTYEEELQEQVYGPLGLARTSLPVGIEIPKPYIHGYDNDPSQRPPEDISEVLASGWPWASGGMVSSPGDLNRFIRGYVGGRLFNAETQAQQRQLVEGGHSDPPGPGKNDAGLGIFRYQTRCGTVWGHTGSYPGYMQFAAASPDGRRSVTVSVNVQLSTSQGAPGVFAALRRAELLAVCAALAQG
jgi:D-alanyl-D-alanine carboxypeptidase